jgi:Sulfotransferase domain
MKLISKLLQTVFNKPEKWLYSFGILSTKGLCLPDFLGIGAQKSGTMWLYENLRYHPEIIIPENPNDPHYFEQQFHRSLAFYSSKFKGMNTKIKGEIRPAYGILPLHRIKFIRTIMPDIKLFFIMRNPIDRAWSHALMNLVTQSNRKYEEVNESEFYAHFRSERSMIRGNYPAILGNWLSIFPIQQLYIGFLDDIKNRPQKMLEDIFKHLGASTHVNWSSFPYNKIINVGPTIPIPDKYREFLNEMYSHQIESLYKRFDGSIEAWRCS